LNQTLVSSEVLSKKATMLSIALGVFNCMNFVNYKKKQFYLLLTILCLQHFNFFLFVATVHTNQSFCESKHGLFEVLQSTLPTTLALRRNYYSVALNVNSP
jgi:hypothetical protein